MSGTLEAVFDGDALWSVLRDTGFACQSAFKFDPRQFCIPNDNGGSPDCDVKGAGDDADRFDRVLWLAERRAEGAVRPHHCTVRLDLLPVSSRPSARIERRSGRGVLYGSPHAAAQSA